MSQKTTEILERGLQLVESVSYKVSLRWVFYRLLQEGYYSKKKDYDAWDRLCSRARHNFRMAWHPNTLADETRSRIPRSGGFKTIQDCIDELKYDLFNYEVLFSLNHFYRQKKYVEIWFEARAMAQQFRQYTDGIDLIPFGGQPSIPLKWDTAKHLERISARYQKPITVLYFGDCDPYGNIIRISAEKDVRKWCDVDFELIKCGLTQDQAVFYGVPENPAKPGEYQWEALSDHAAAEIIQSSVSDHIDTQIIEELDDECREHEQVWRKKIRQIFKDIDLDKL